VAHARGAVSTALAPAMASGDAEPTTDAETVADGERLFAAGLGRSFRLRGGHRSCRGTHRTAAGALRPAARLTALCLSGSLCLLGGIAIFGHSHEPAASTTHSYSACGTSPWPVSHSQKPGDEGDRARLA